MLGWDIGTFEFLSDEVVAENYPHAARLKMRTGGSVGKLGRHLCHSLQGGAGHRWDMSKLETKKQSRLPVKHRYRSPVVFEFHEGRGSPKAHAVLWLQHLIDNEPTDIDIPIYKTGAAARLTQNYITEQNYEKSMPGLEDLEVIGRLKLRGRFKAGMDESHEHFVSDNDSRETYESWEACLAEGVRQHVVEKELPERIQTLHEESLTEGRDILRNSEPVEKEKWLSKDGTDWSGAFGQDPKKYASSKERTSENARREQVGGAEEAESDDDDDDDDSDTSDSDSDLGIQDARNRKSVDTAHTTDTNNGISLGEDSSLYSTNSKGVNKQNKRSEERKQRGLMQWKPARNLKFAKDEGKIGLRKVKNKIMGGLDGRQPGVETETGT